jgi:hypothetical protein
VTIDAHLQPRAVLASSIVFATTFNAKLVDAVTPPQGPRTPRNHAQTLALPEATPWKIATDNRVSLPAERQHTITNSSKLRGYHSLNKLISVILFIGAWMDNIGAGCIAQYVINNNRTNIDVKYRLIRNWILKDIFELFHIESNKNIADTFTKALPAPAHRGLAHRLLSGIS